MRAFAMDGGLLSRGAALQDEVAHKRRARDGDAPPRTLNVMRAALPRMRERGYGRIVNMSSLAVRRTIAGGAYGAAKGAIEDITRSAALESAKHGMTINCVAPGLIDAGMFRSVPEKYQQQQEAKIPFGRAGTADEVAECVAFLASPGQLCDWADTRHLRRAIPWPLRFAWSAARTSRS